MNSELSSSETTQVDSVPEPSRRGRLKNGNPSGDFHNCPRCGAKTRKGIPCKSPAMANGRCRMHGGASTGPRTPEGLQRSRRGNWKHGRYSWQALAQAKFERSLTRALLLWAKSSIHQCQQIDAMLGEPERPFSLDMLNMEDRRENEELLATVDELLSFEVVSKDISPRVRRQYERYRARLQKAFDTSTDSQSG
jgi:hypothetical protein